MSHTSNWDFELKSSRQNFELIKPYLDPQDRVLDFGSGAGYLTKFISERIGAHVQDIDVIDISRTNRHPKIYNGNSIPFPNNSFDISVCAFVLHHTTHHLQLLRELERVTAKRLIILEDLWGNPWDNLLCIGHTLFSKFVYKSGQMKFQTSSKWESLFEQSGWEVLHKNTVPRSHTYFYPVKRVLYVLEKGTG